MIAQNNIHKLDLHEDSQEMNEAVAAFGVIRTLGCHIIKQSLDETERGPDDHCVSISYLLRNLETGRLVTRSECHIQKMASHQEPEEDHEISQVTHSILKPDMSQKQSQDDPKISQNHSHDNSQVSLSGKEVASGGQGASLGQGADQAPGLPCTCSRLPNPAARPSALALGAALNPAPNSGCRASSHWPAICKTVTFSDVIEIFHAPFHSVFTLHAQDNETLDLFVQECQEGRQATRRLSPLGEKRVQ